MMPDSIPRDLKGAVFGAQLNRKKGAHINIQLFLWQHFLSPGGGLHENK